MAEELPILGRSRQNAEDQKDNSDTLLERPLASVIIPHYNDLDNLKICLELLIKQTFPRDKYEIIVADNNSACGIDKVVEACAGIARVVPAPVQGAGPARDVAVRNSSGLNLAFIDSDCLPAKDWLEQGVKALSDYDMVGGKVIVSVVDPQNPTPTEAFELVFAFDNKKYVEVTGYSISANMFVRRSVFENVGGFLPDVSEDFEWGRRATALGYRWKYEEGARITHPARRTWPELLRKWRRLTRESVYTSARNRFGIPVLIAHTWVVAISPVVHSPKVLTSRKLNGMGQKLSALGVLYRLRMWRFVETHRELLKRR